MCTYIYLTEMWINFDSTKLSFFNIHFILFNQKVS